MHMKNILLFIVGGILVILYFIFQDDINQKVAPKTPVPTVETMVVKAYFQNSVSDPALLDCSNVYAVSRTVPKSVEVARVSLEELLEGPSIDEVTAGYVSSINPGTLLNSIRIEEGVAYVDFSSVLGQAVAGSCRVQSIRAQIDRTLLQLPTVTSVVISIEGETEGILQP